MQTKICKTIIVGFFLFALQLALRAQQSDGMISDTLKYRVDTITSTLENLNSDVDILKRLKISGYVQAQFQLADTMGAATFSGGNFPATTNQRFQIRRGRIKLAYDSPLGGVAIQLNASEKGVNLKDAYVYLIEPYLNAFRFTLGAFDRPFGHEVSYSSSSLESPERARINQSLFPGESDMGGMLTFQMPKTSRFNFIKLDAGLFSGNGVGTEVDKKVDFIGRLSMSKATKNEVFKYGVGVSYYNGNYYQGVKIYTMDKLTDGSNAYVVNDNKTNKGTFAKREYVGADVQISYDSPIGISQLRAEYITGKQPANAGTNKSPENYAIAEFEKDTYVRNINGGYIIFAQNIADTKHQLVLKYDWYDPNTKVKGKEIKEGNFFTKNDIKFSTFGLGWNYRLSNNLKITAYYDVVNNEIAAIKGFDRNLKDNVFTFRIQGKF